MNILMVSQILPSPTSGGSTRNYHLLKALASKHTVSLLALGECNEQSTSELARLTRMTQVITPPKSYPKRMQQLVDVVCGKSYILNSYYLVEMQDVIDALSARDHYDIVLFESVLMACYRLPEGIKVVIDQHNIEYELRLRTYQRERAWLRKWYNWMESRLLKPIEIERCQRADVVLVTSERERLSLKNMLPDSVIEVVPNGVDIEAFQRICSEQEVPGQIIFTGSMEYYPNVDAVLFFAQKCWPLIRAQVPDATWQIVGKNPLPKVWKLTELPGIMVTGSVPDVRPYLAATQVAIVPLLVGSGTRLKILEALAMQKAVVSTSLGCEGLSVVSGKHLRVADQPEAFAQEVVGLLRNPAMRTALGTTGRALVEAEYSWERCGAQLLLALDKIV
jgi:sugar transferase (PEP-CTERM/EpsH1 system associated)